MSTAVSRSEKQKQIDRYLETHNVYGTGCSLGYDVGAISRYAKKKGCEIKDLTKEEADRFCVIIRETADN